MPECNELQIPETRQTYIYTTVIAVCRPESVARRRLALRRLQAGEFHRVGGRAGTDALHAQPIL